MAPYLAQDPEIPDQTSARAGISPVAARRSVAQRHLRYAYVARSVGGPLGSGQRGEGVGVPGPHGVDVAAVEGGDLGDAESFGESVQARLSWSSRSAAATSGAGVADDHSAQERPNPSASRSSWLRPRSVRPMENEPNHDGGHSGAGCDWIVGVMYAQRCRVSSSSAWIVAPRFALRPLCQLPL